MNVHVIVTNIGKPYITFTERIKIDVTDLVSPKNA
jgi:hypothetical protein